MSSERADEAGHDHGVGDAGRSRLIIALAITAVVFVAEVIGAVVTGSLALLSDAAHMLVDTSGLLIALIASILITRPPSARRTWGFQRAEVIAASAQSVLLLAAGVFIAIEAVKRLMEPPQIQDDLLVIFGVVGLLGNVACLVVLMSARRKSMNLKAAFLDVVADTLGSIAVIVAAIVILTTGFTQADPIAAILIGALIVPRALVLLRETMSVLLETTPKGIDLDLLREHFLDLDHVRDVHDLHVTQIATGLPVLTAHVVVDDECFRDGHAPKMLDQLQACVAAHFPVSIEHSTFQLEPAGHGAHEHPTHA